MKNSNHKLGLFGLLVFSLSMSQGWLQADEGVNSRSFASTSAIYDESDPNLSNTNNNGTASRRGHQFDVETTVNGKKFKDTFTYTQAMGTRTVQRLRNGELVDVEVRGVEASFCSSLSCGDKYFVVIPEEHQDDTEWLKGILQTYAVELLVKQQTAQAELEEKRGDLEARQAAAKECRKIVVDENDKSKDIDLTLAENDDKQTDCRLARFKEREFDSNDDRYKAFADEFGEELREIALSNDGDAQAKIRRLSRGISDSRLGNYLEGVQKINADFENAVRAAEMGDLATLQYMSNWYQFGQYRYETKQGGWGPFQTYRTTARNRFEVQAFNDLRNDMVQRLQMAIQNPSSIYGEPGSIMDRGGILADSMGRGGRMQTGWSSLPGMNSNNYMTNPTGNMRGALPNSNGVLGPGQMNTGNNCGGQWVRPGTVCPPNMSMNNNATTLPYPTGMQQRGMQQPGMQRGVYQRGYPQGQYQYQQPYSQIPQGRVPGRFS